MVRKDVLLRRAKHKKNKFEDNALDNLLHPVVKGFKGKKSKIENMNGFGRVIVMILDQRS